MDGWMDWHTVILCHGLNTTRRRRHGEQLLQNWKTPVDAIFIFTKLTTTTVQLGIDAEHWRLSLRFSL